MAILKVARIGNPVIREVAQPIEQVGSPHVQRLIDDMIETMHEHDGVGLAAPQVHASLRLVVIEVPSSVEGAGDGVPLTVLVNPVVRPLGAARSEGWEGCLSIPDLRGLVPRVERVRLEAMDREGRAYVAEASGFFARVIQHECDHLDGIVYLDRMEDLRSLAFLREFERYAIAAEEL
jgi:peptide deformylase